MMMVDKDVRLSGSKASVTYSEDGSVLFFRNAGAYLPDHVEVQTIRLQFECLPPW